MLRLAFNGVHNVIVSDLETTLPQPSYTLQTVDYLTQANPDTLFYLCIGQDSLSAFHTWYKYEEILAKTDLLVAERPGYPTDQLARSEEHTSELQSRGHLVCRHLLEKKKKTKH